MRNMGGCLPHVEYAIYFRGYDVRYEHWGGGGKRRVWVGVRGGGVVGLEPNGRVWMGKATRGALQRGCLLAWYACSW